MNIQVDALQNQALEKEKQYNELTAILAAMTKEVSNLEEVSNKRSEESDNLKKGLEEQKGLNTDVRFAPHGSFFLVSWFSSRDKYSQFIFVAIFSIFTAW
jgi:predicted nuclease with TOPRIM domain